MFRARALRLRAPWFLLAPLLAACSKGSPSGDQAKSNSTSTISPSGDASSRSANEADASDLISGASPRWDAASNAALVNDSKDAVDGAALRAKHRARLEKDLSPVTVLSDEGPLDLGQHLCEQAVPVRDKATKILIKPNLGGIEWFRDPEKSEGDDGLVGRITHPEFVRGIVRCLKARGHAAITVADGFGHTHAEWKRLVRESGYEAMAAAENVRLVALDDDGVFDREGERPGEPLRVRGLEKTTVPTLLMPRVLAEHLEQGLFISAPKIKAHRFAVASVAIKGMQGTVMFSDATPAFHQKWRSHRELGPVLTAIKLGAPDARARYVEALEIFSKRMTDVLELEAPDVVLAEGAPAMGGDGFGKQWPTKERFAVGGTNPILVDRVATTILGLFDNDALGRELNGHRASPLLEDAAKSFHVDLKNVSVRGGGAHLFSEKRPYHLVGMANFELHSDATKNTHPNRDVLGPSPSAKSDAGLPNSDKPELHALRVQGAPKIDGNLDEDFWKKAVPVRFDTDWSGASTNIPTTVRAAWSKEALYVSWEIAATDFSIDRARPVSAEREKLYEEDCVELFLGVDAGNPTRYFEIELGAAGHFFDLAIDRNARTSDATWSSDLEIKTREDLAGRKATIEAAFRAPAITHALVNGASLPLGLYRMEGRGPRRYLAWSPTRTPKPNFHVPNAFGRLVLDGP